MIPYTVLCHAVLYSIAVDQLLCLSVTVMQGVKKGFCGPSAGGQCHLTPANGWHSTWKWKRAASASELGAVGCWLGAK
jgi:hypothetical protein